MIKSGCCGFAVKGGAQAYYELFDLVELQSTFYKLPKTETAQRWRKEAPVKFEFVVKAWQTITHLSSSPTWRRSGMVVGEKERTRYGHLKPTAENFEAWNGTLKMCRILGLNICLI